MKVLKMLGLHVSFPISNEVAIYVLTQEKKAVFLRFSNYLVKSVQLRYQKKTLKKVRTTMVDFNNKVLNVYLNDRYEHMNSRNDRLMMRLKAIEAEYYSIEN